MTKNFSKLDTTDSEKLENPQQYKCQMKQNNTSRHMIFKLQKIKNKTS